MRYLFEDYCIDIARREMRRGKVAVPLAPQVFDIIEYLIRNRDRVVAKEELIGAIWSGRTISDEALTTRLNVARNAIGDNGQEQRLIKTFLRKGFRFVGEVRQEGIAENAACTGPSSPRLTLADKPSIAVLPFANLSSDPEQDYFADGMVEDITTALSRSKSLFVIARNSSFTYKGKAVDVRLVGRELGVRYVLEGSVRKSENRVRITGQLIDASTANHLWADRFDGELEGIFDLQDRVAASVVGAIAPRLEQAEIERSRRKPTESLQAYDYHLRALACLYRYTQQSNIETLKFTRMANELDPEFAASYALASGVLSSRKAFGWRVEPDAESGEARRLADRALALSRDDPWVLAMAGQTLSFVASRVEEGAHLLSRAISLDPNLAMARTFYGYTQVYLGNPEAAIDQLKVALRLSPVDPRIFLTYAGLALGYFFAGRHEEAASAATIALRQQPHFLGANRAGMASLAMSGRIEEARQACAQALRLDPTQRVSNIPERIPLRRPDDVAQLAEAFRIAGLPE